MSKMCIIIITFLLWMGSRHILVSCFILAIITSFFTFFLEEVYIDQWIRFFIIYFIRPLLYLPLRYRLFIIVLIIYRLTCRYMTENDPFLTIAPIKVEMMYLDPAVVLFHDVLSDAEIETIKDMSRPRVSFISCFYFN